MRFKLVVDHPTPAHFTSLGQYLRENVRVTSFLLGENVWVTSMLLGEGTSLPRGGHGKRPIRTAHNQQNPECVCDGPASLLLSMRARASCSRWF